MIPQDFIDDLLARTDIVELIRSRVELKPAGREWKGCCPFHNEKTPSFHVVPHKGFYHCFGCGAHGTAIDFIKDFDRLEFPAAIEALAQLAGVEVPRQGNDAQAARNKALYTVLDRAQQYFRDALKADSPARLYLEKRGVSEDMIARYELGFAPPGWQFLSDKLKPEADAEQAGMIIIKDDGRAHDRFRNRLMFPIRDTRGRIVAFGGRTLDDDPAKYLNSPETPVFHKGRMAYGLYEARQAKTQLDRIIVVEGYMDVIALAQHGFPEAVATLGTATSADHLQLLSRQASRIVFCFDGDAAGLRAADRALDVCLSALRDGLDIRFMFLPDGDDPDSLLHQEGAEAFEARLNQSVPLSERLLAKLSEGHDLNAAEGRAALMERARKVLAPIDAPAFRALMLAELEQSAGLNQQTVSQLIGPAPAREVQRKMPGRAKSQMTPVRRAIIHLLNFPACAQAYTDVEGLAHSEVAGVALLSELIDRLHSRPELNCAALINGFAGRPEQDILERLSMVDPEIEESDAIKEFTATCEKLRNEAQKSELELLQQAVRLGQLDADGIARLKVLYQQQSEAKKASS